MRDYIQPGDPSGYPKFILDLMGWEPGTAVATPTYPCVIDETHQVARLYNIINVPTSVWIDEEGLIVRPPEPAGASDAFRSMDPKTYRMPEDAVRSSRAKRKVYVQALIDWIQIGKKSKHALSADNVSNRLKAPSESEALAAANFRLGVELHRMGHQETSLKYFEEAKRLHPESWSYKRQSWELEEPGKAAGPAFWSAVSALGEKRYYPPIDMEGMPQ